MRVRTAIHGRSTEAEIRSILEQAAKPEGRLKLGSLLTSIAREAGGLTDDEADQPGQVAIGLVGSTSMRLRWTMPCGIVRPYS
ncbi:MAG: hypothetical protein AAAB35_08110 [Phyllobacterium sp.]|uniref:FitA-like ribbon-helix-helix domain-containing protein n=1 Tax=Phyllobacterium sp. TaxID=1871046 RepID=UPI0030F07C14